MSPGVDWLQNQMTALIYAAKNGYKSIVEALIDAGTYRNGPYNVSTGAVVCDGSEW